MLTDPLGEYALRAPAPGRYRVETKRIGIRRERSDWLALGDGETRTFDVALDALSYSLPEVVVSAINTCAAARRDAPRVGALWEEARAALVATQISLRDRLFHAEMASYVRELSPKDFRVLSQTQAGARGIVENPFVALPPESLTVNGYRRDAGEGLQYYYAPDANVLTSDMFLEQHCFRLVPRQRNALVGLAFDPTSRERSDIRGTLWLDATTYELRHVEFLYTGLIDVADSLRIGGEVHFDRLPSGAWYVKRWFVRMPQHGRQRGFALVLRGNTPTVLVRPVDLRLREEGGEITAESARTGSRAAIIAGSVLDSTGTAPLARGVARLMGTTRAVALRMDGTFRLDSVPPGRHTIRVEQPAYDSLGVEAIEASADVREGTVERMALRAGDTPSLVARLCPGTRLGAGTGVLRVLFATPAGAPIPNALVGVSPEGSEERSVTREGRTDARGAIVFCGIPARAPVTVYRVLSDGTRDPLGMAPVNAGGVVAYAVRGRAE
jgi:hypothetical protein